MKFVALFSVCVWEKNLCIFLLFFSYIGYKYDVYVGFGK